MAGAIDKGTELDRYSKRHIHYYTEEIPALIEEIFKNNKIKNVGDLGSGDGAILYALLKKGYLEDIQSIVAVDISNERISRVKEISGKIRAIAVDICDLHMIDSMTLDLVMSSQVIEHVQDEKRLLDEAYRVLRPNGFLYLSTVYKRWYGWYFYRCRGRWVLDPTHLREYQSENQLLDLFKGYNFKLLENSMKLQWFPVTDFVFKRIGMGRQVYNNKTARLLRNIKIPIFGYYNWELVFKKG